MPDFATLRFSSIWKQVRQPRLSKQLISLILLLYLGIAMILTAVQLVAEYQIEQSRLELQIKAVAESFTPTITESLWNYEEESITASLTGIYRVNTIYGAQINDLHGAHWAVGYTKNSEGAIQHTRASIQTHHENTEHTSKNNQNIPQNKQLNLHTPFTQLYSAHFPIIKQNDSAKLETIGHLTLYYSSVTLFERTWTTFLMVTITAIIKTLCLWVISVLVISRVVSTPLIKLRDHVDQFDFDTTEYRSTSSTTTSSSTKKPKPNSDEKNELYMLDESVDRFCSTLANRNIELNEYRRSLEQKVDQRTQELTNVLEELKRASKIKSDFLATMTHEIRTPMNAVLGSIQLLKKTPLNDRQRELIDTVNVGGKALMVIVDDILDLSKIEANKLELEQTPFDITKLIQQCVNIFSAKANEKSITLTFQACESALPPLLGDPTRLSQVINNLISNALKFTQEGGIIISLTSSEMDHNRLPVTIKIHDTGIGMSKKQQAHLFEAFHQADTSTTRHFGGTGLGLAICKRLVNLMQGSIDVESTQGLGSEFTINLMFDISEQPLKKDLESKATEYTPKRILLADDTPLNTVIASDLLKEAGHDIEITCDGFEAVEFYVENYASIDIILMDCLMPNMDGYDATQAIRKFEQSNNLPRTPVIALTANAYKESKDRCLAVGMDDFITKPIDQTIMLNAIERAK